MTISTDPELLAAYHPVSGAFDEMVDADGSVRQHWGTLAAALDEMGAVELANRGAEASRLLDDDGVHYRAASDVDSDVDRWRLDPVPVVVSGDEWGSLERAVAQRAEVLDLLLADIYGPRDLVRRGIIPPEVVYGHPGFLRGCDQVRLAWSHQLFLTAVDVARDGHGDRVALSDRAQAPSGAGYALENRIVVSRVLPDLYRDSEVRRLAPFFRTLRASLQQVAPATSDTPRIVVLTPGRRSETAFEHAFLASYLGYPLVQGSDLRVRDGRVWMRTLGRLEPVHVILRRVDAEFCDPLELRPGSHLGVPGLLEACRLGTVAVVNTLGSGVLENPALMSFLPQLCEELLDESLRLPSVQTWWCGDDSARSHVLANLDRLVIKPVARGESTATLLGWELDPEALDSLRRKITAHPHGWVGQDPIAIGAVPALVERSIEPRRAVLRMFAVARAEGFAVMPGGLTRVAADEVGALITNQHGALSKDTWVLSDEPEKLTGFWLQSGPAVDAIEPEASMSSRAAENLFWLTRYAERAEGLVRLLRVVSDRRNEFAPGTNPAGDACLTILFGALTATTGTWPGFLGEGGAALNAAPSAELRSLVVDETRAGSLAYDTARMLEAASEVRDQLSADTWLVVGQLDRDLGVLDRHFALGSAQGALGRVMQALLALSGLSAESLVRDPAWQFMEIGRRLERAIQLCGLLEATVVAPADTATDSLVLESVLTAAESIITYRRRYRSRAQLETVLDLLVLDPQNPRSLAYQVDQLRMRAAELPQGGSHRPSDLERLVLEAYTAVHLADSRRLAEAGSGERREDLEAFLGRVKGLLSRAAASVDAAHFTHQLPQRAVFSTGNAGGR